MTEANKIKASEESVRYDTDFNSAKETVLSNYNTKQATLSERLIGFIVALFAFLEISKSSNLSFATWFDVIKTCLFFSGLLFLTSLIIWQLFRYGVYSQMTYYILVFRESELQNYLKDLKDEDSVERSMHFAILFATIEKVKEKKILGFKILYFLSTKYKRERIGGLISVLFGCFASIILLILLL